MENSNQHLSEFSFPVRSYLRASLKKMPEGIHVDHELCDKCGQCVVDCPRGLLIASPSGVRSKEGAIHSCDGNNNCGVCTQVCGNKRAITVCKKDEHRCADGTFPPGSQFAN